MELATPGSAARQVSAVRHVTDCAMRLSSLMQVSLLFSNNQQLPELKSSSNPGRNVNGQYVKEN